MRQLMPGLAPDRAFLAVIATMFPAGLRGLLIAGLMASLLSAVNGLLMSSSTLAVRDIYLKLIPRGRRTVRAAARSAQLAVIAAVVLLLPVAARSRSIIAFIQHFMADVFGVMIAWFLVGAFSRRAAPRAAFSGAVAGIVLAVCLDLGTALNFAYVGFLSFLSTVAVTLVLSRREAPVAAEKLSGLTVRHDAADSSWSGIWKWSLGSLAAYLIATLCWELYLRR
jgi:SSS family solute:Na+ symporter